MDNLIFRKENSSDYLNVFALNKKAFNRDDEAKLVEALRKNAEVFLPNLSIVAALKSKVLGHILFSRIKIVSDRKKVYEALSLAPMAVLPAYQKRGIGSRLIEIDLVQAIEEGFKSVIVLGHTDYYPKFGFKPAINWGIKAPFNVPTNAFMAIELVKGSLMGVSGMVSYLLEFGV